MLTIENSDNRILTPTINDIDENIESMSADDREMANDNVERRP